MTSKHQILQVYDILFSRTLFWRNEPAWSILGAMREIAGSCPLRADSHLAAGLENSFPPASKRAPFSLIHFIPGMPCARPVVMSHMQTGTVVNVTQQGMVNSLKAQSIEIPWQCVLCFVS